MASEIIIKGMVCSRCISVITDGVIELGYHINKVTLGKLELSTPIDDTARNKIGAFLSANGFEMMTGREMKLVSQVKQLINELITGNERHRHETRLSVYLSDKLNMNYNSISELFRQIEGITVEHYVISKRLEKVKELIVYTNKSLTEIASITGFSSINHLSRQFKQLTGLTPTHFKRIRTRKESMSESSSK